MTAWLGVASRDHVRTGVAAGFAQIGHGRKAGLDRMQAGDGLIYYSSRASMEDTRPLQAFTALGEIVDDEPWQADTGGFRPWRRRVDFVADSREVPLAALRADLDLTAGPNWGVQLRRGLVVLTRSDFDRIAEAMRSTG